MPEAVSLIASLPRALTDLLSLLATNPIYEMPIYFPSFIIAAIFGLSLAKLRLTSRIVHVFATTRVKGQRHCRGCGA
jgi:hypothetical protein